MDSEYKVISKKKLHDGFFKLHELNFIHKKHDGSWSSNVTREVFSGAHVSTVLPYDPVKKKILLLKQFRAGVINRKHNPQLLEIVAGIVDKGETPEDAAIRECAEETGCKTNILKKIYSYYPAPGSSESFYHFFLAEINAFEGQRILGQTNESEDILVRSYNIDEVRNLLNEGNLINGVTLMAIQWFFLNYYKN